MNVLKAPLAESNADNPTRNERPVPHEPDYLREEFAQTLSAYSTLTRDQTETTPKNQTESKSPSDQLPGLDFQTSDGRSFSRLGNSNIWQVNHPGGQPELVNNLRFNPDHSISYNVGPAKVREFPDNHKHVDVDGVRFEYDAQGRLQRQLPIPTPHGAASQAKPGDASSGKRPGARKVDGFSPEPEAAAPKATDLTTIDTSKLDTSTAKKLASEFAAAGKTDGSKISDLLEKGMGGPNKKQVMEGIVAAMSANGGNDKLTELLLKGAGQDEFNAVAGKVATMASEGNAAAIKTLAVLATGVADKKIDGLEYGYSTWARGHLLDAAQKPELASTVTSSLVEAKQFHDTQSKDPINSSFFEALGKAVGSIAPDSQSSQDKKAINSALDVMRKELDSRLKSGTETDQRSFAKGMFAMAPHLTAKDADAIVKHLGNPIVLEALEKNSEKLSQSFKKELATQLASVVSTGRAFHGGIATKGDLKAALHALPAVANQLTAQDLHGIATGVGVDRERPLSKELKLSESDRKDMRSLMGEIALSALLKSDSMDTGKQAIAILKSGLAPDRQLSQKETQTISQMYPDGKVQGADMIGQLGALTRSLGMPASSEQMLAEAGIPPSRIKEYTDAIQKNLSKYGSADEVLRTVLNNARIANALSAEDRAELMGWTKGKEKGESAAERQGKAPLRDLGLIAEMVNNTLDSSSNAALLNPKFADELSKLSGNASETARADKKELTNLHAERTKKLNELVRITKDGPDKSTAGDLLRLLGGSLTLGLAADTKAAAGRLVEKLRTNGVDQDLSKRQSALLDAITSLSTRLDAAGIKAAQSEGRATHLDLVTELGKYNRFLSEGKTSWADSSAIEINRRFGIADGAVNGDGTAGGALSRYSDKGKTDWNRLPDYRKADSRNKSDGATDAYRSFEAALGLRSVSVTEPGLSRYKPGVSFDTRGLAQMSPAKIADKYVRDTFVQNALRTLDSDPGIAKMAASASKIAKPMEQLSKLFEAGMSGTPYDDFVKSARDNVQQIEKIMAEVKSEDVLALRMRIEAMERAKELMTRDGADKDPNNKAFAELDQRLTNLKGVHDMFNRFDHARFGEMLRDKDGAPLRNPTGGIMYKDSYSQLRQMMNAVNEGAIKPATFTNWMKEHGPLIAASVGAMAATAAAVGTLGGASGVAVAGWSAVATLASREATRELLYQVNKGGYTGVGTYGDTGADSMHLYRLSGKRDLGDNLSAAGRLALKTAGELSWDAGTNILTSGIAGGILGGARPSAFTRAFAQQLEKSPNLLHLAYKAERINQSTKGLSYLKSAANEYKAHFFNELGHTLGFAGGHIALSSAIKDDFAKSMIHKSGWHLDQMVDAGLTTSLAIGSGVIRAARLNANKQELHYDLSPGHSKSDFIKFYQKEGYSVKQSATNPSVWEATPIATSRDAKPLKLIEGTEKSTSTTARSGDVSTAGETTPQETTTIDTAHKSRRKGRGLEEGEQKKTRLNPESLKRPPDHFYEPSPGADSARLKALLDQHKIPGAALLRDDVIEPLTKALRSAYDSASTPADRAKALETALNETCKKLNIPPIELKLNKDNYNDGGYAKGKISVDEGTLSRKEYLIETLTHELTHHEQLTLMSQRINELLPDHDRGNPKKILDYWKDNIMATALLDAGQIEQALKLAPTKLPADMASRADHLLKISKPSDASNQSSGLGQWSQQRAERSLSISSNPDDNRLRNIVSDQKNKSEIRSLMRHESEEARNAVGALLDKQTPLTSKELDVIRGNLKKAGISWLTRSDKYSTSYLKHLMEVEARVVGNKSANVRN